MNRYIAYCGLDCEKCEARIATKNNDNNLRKEVAKKWSELNKAYITEEMINCVGCRIDGVKTPFCESMCQIRQCAMSKKLETCGSCEDIKTCDKIKMTIKNNNEALDDLKKG